jgi:hypothetical protein
LITFQQREDLACELGDRLSLWLLEKHVCRDPMAAPAGEVRCPKCRRPAQLKPSERPPPTREVSCERGEVAFGRLAYQCGPCRVTFFPLGPQLGSGHRGI